jgi:hypothetical protein
VAPTGSDVTRANPNAPSVLEKPQDPYTIRLMEDVPKLADLGALPASTASLTQ